MKYYPEWTSFQELYQRATQSSKALETALAGRTAYTYLLPSNDALKPAMQVCVPACVCVMICGGVRVTGCLCGWLRGDASGEHAQIASKEVKHPAMQLVKHPAMHLLPPKHTHTHTGPEQGRQRRPLPAAGVPRAARDEAHPHRLEGRRERQDAAEGTRHQGQAWREVSESWACLCAAAVREWVNASLNSDEALSARHLLASRTGPMSVVAQQPDGRVAALPALMGVADRKAAASALLMLLQHLHRSF